MKKQLWSILAISLMLMPLFLTVYTIPIGNNIDGDGNPDQIQDENINGDGNLKKLNPISSSLPTFTVSSVTTSAIVAQNLTALSVYDIRPSTSESPDILVGAANGYFYLCKGIENPFQSDSWSTVSYNTAVASEVRSVIPLHMNGLSDNHTDLYVSNKLGNQFYYKQTDESRRHLYSGSGAFGIGVGNQGDAAGEITGDNPTGSVKTELGGKHDLNDEIVVGLSNGHIVYVVTEDIQWNSVVSDYIEKTISTAYSSYILDIAVGDMNNDGDNDVVAAYASGTIYTFQNDGTPDNGAWTSQATASRVARAIELSDLNLDGKLDLISGTSGGEVYIYQNNGNPHGSSFTEVQKIDVNQIIRDIKSADIDMDGDNDIVCALENNTILFLENPLHMPVGSTELNPFAAGYWNQYVISISSGVPNLLEIVDMDYDGDNDVVTVTSNGWVRLLKNNIAHDTVSDFVFGPKELIITNPYAGRFNKIAYGDLDNDGDLDIAVGSYNAGTQNGTITVYKNPGHTVFRDFTIPNTWTSYIAYGKKSVEIYSLILDDIDNNGYLDILFIENKTISNIAIRGIKHTGNPWVNYWDKNNATILVQPSTYAAAISDLMLLDNLDGDNRKEFLWVGQTGDNQRFVTAFRQQTNPWLPWNDAMNISSNPSGNAIIGMVTGYITDDNYKDLAYYDYYGHLYIAKGTRYIDTLLLGSVKAALSLPGGSAVTTIATNDWNKDLQTDIAFGMIGLNTNLHALNPNWYTSSGDYTTSDWTRTQIMRTIKGITCLDLNKNGLKDYIFWNESAIFSLKGNIADGVEEVYSLIENFPGKSITDVELADFDQDGDPDLVISVFNSTASELYYFANRKGDDIVAPTLTLAIKPVYSAKTVVINVTSSETLYSAPQISIKIGTSTTYATMTPNGTALTWTYVHTVSVNGTHAVSVNGTDIYGNVRVTTGVFYGDKILPVLTLSVFGDVRAGYSNGSVTIRVTNTTDRVGNNKIGLNVTHPVLGTHYYAMVDYNPSENAFIASYNSVTVNGVYTVGVNASDQYFVDYTYISTTFQGDLNAPQTVKVSEPNVTTRDSYLSNKMLHFNATFNEPIIHLDVYAWRTGEGNLSNFIEYYTDYMGEISVNFTFDLPRGVKDEINLTFTFIDRAGNYNSYTKNISITVFPPVYCGFFFIDSDTEAQYITETTKRIVFIQWSGVNFSTLMYRINDGAWSTAIPANHPERMAYPIDLGSTGGTLTITVRFMNDDDYVDVQSIIIYNPPLAEIPWQWILISLGVVAIAGILIKFTRPHRKEKSWKEFLDK